MNLGNVPLNALRAFEASARHLSFTRAGLELRVTQAAVSHQVKALEDRLGVALFRRLPRGLALTDEGMALSPTLHDAFARIGDVLERFDGGRVHEILSVGVVGTFAVGWLLPRLPAFRQAHPFLDLRLFTNNNRPDLAGEGLDCAIRFGLGAWHGTEAVDLLAAPLAPLCAPQVAARLDGPRSLAGEVLLRSYRADDWLDWFAAAGVSAGPIRGPVFDSSRLMVEAAMLGEGVALAPPAMFASDLAKGRLVQPFAQQVDTGRYWLTWLKSHPVTPGLAAFRDWLVDTAAATDS